MEALGTVSSEGGPLLLADAQVAAAWQGVEGNGSDYERACKLFAQNEHLPGGPISIGQEQGILWELGGAGTAHIFCDSTDRLSLRLVRGWLHSPRDTNAVLALAAVPLRDTIGLGSLKISSGVLAILWAPESGEWISTLPIPESARPAGPMSVDGAGLLVHLPQGCYICLYDEVQLEDGQHARRCHLLPAER